MLGMTKGSGSMAAVIVASCLFASGGALMKVSDGFTRVWPSAGVIDRVRSRRLPVRQGAADRGTVDASGSSGSGIEAAVSVVLGLWLFSEQFSSFQIAGIVLILGGTVLTELA